MEKLFLIHLPDYQLEKDDYLIFIGSHGKSYSSKEIFKTTNLTPNS